MNRYIPNTQTINQDREYFVESDIFVKVDSIVDRGKNEAQILSGLSHPHIQEYVGSREEDGKHILETRYFEGETLENIKLSKEDLIAVESQLMKVLSYLIEKQVTHGDINVSNILFDGNNIQLIDWETARQGDAVRDLFGPDYPSKHCGIVNVIRIMRENTL